MVDTNGLNDLISKYEYGQFNILDNGMNITYNPEMKQVEFEPFYHFDPHSTKGSCSELMNAAYVEIRERFPEYHVTRVIGNDPDFFTDKKAMHCFLFVSEEDLMNKQLYTEDFSTIRKAISKKPLIVDPSFHKVVPYADSGYRVQRLFNTGCDISYSHNAVFDNYCGAPLGIDSHGDLVHLIINFHSPYLMDIVVQPSKKPISHYQLDDPELKDRFSKDPNIMKFIDLLKGREKTRKITHCDC